MTPRPGCYGVVRTGGLAARAIRLGTRSPVNHAFIVVGADRVIEATPHGARYGTLSQYAGRLVACNDLEPLTGEQRDRIVDAAEAMLGTPYGFVDIAALAAACLVGRDDVPGWAWNRITDSRTAVCSQLVAQCYAAAGVHLVDGVLPCEVTPGDLAVRLLTRPWETALAAA